MAETALDLVTIALLDLGVLADEETPSASQAAGGLRKLNNLIDAWNIEGLMVYGAKSYTLPLIAGQGSYTIGTGGNLNTARPNNILSAYIRNPSLPAAQRYDFPINVLTQTQYADVGFKGMTQSLPYGVYFDNLYPLITAYVFPVPSTSEYSLVFWADGIIGNLTLTDDISLAPGYKRALEANLSLELAPSYEAQISEITVQIAQSSKEDLKLQNFTLNTLSIDPRLTTGYFDINTGRTR